MMSQLAGRQAAIAAAAASTHPAQQEAESAGSGRPCIRQPGREAGREAIGWQAGGHCTGGWAGRQAGGCPHLSLSLGTSTSFTASPCSQFEAGRQAGRWRQVRQALYTDSRKGVKGQAGCLGQQQHVGGQAAGSGSCNGMPGRGHCVPQGRSGQGGAGPTGPPRLACGEELTSGSALPRAFRLACSAQHTGRQGRQRWGSKALQTLLCCAPRRQAGSQANKQLLHPPTHPPTHQQLRLVRLLQLKLGGGPLGGLGGHGGALQARHRQTEVRAIFKCSNVGPVVGCACMREC
jgi:hypothetical protein